MPRARIFTVSLLLIQWQPESARQMLVDERRRGESEPAVRTAAPSAEQWGAGPSPEGHG